MYAFVLTTHSYIRWFVLFSLLFAVYNAYKGWLGNKVFTPFDNRVRNITVTIAHIQFVLGLTLYSISPLVSYFLHNFEEAKKNNEIRFFGMEHGTMMIIAIIIITIGSSLSKRKKTDKQKFKTMAIWFTIALIIIFIMIPWKFSSMANRPYFRTL